MTTKSKRILTGFTAIYLIIVISTDISLTGYWSDILFSMIIVIITLKVNFTSSNEKRWKTLLSRSISVLCSILVFGLIALHLITPFSQNSFKMRSFYFENIDERLFNAYYKPVGAYAGGQGSFWITESPVYFPVIEIQKYYNPTVHWDFRIKEWEGKPVDQQEEVRDYIKNEILKQN